MRGFGAFVLGVLLVGISAVSSAQISQEMAEAAVGEDVQLEMLDGSSVNGHLVRLGEGSMVLRDEDGRLFEIVRAEVSEVFVESIDPPDSHARELTRPTSRPLHVIVPRPPPITDTEYEVAQRRFRSGTALRAVGIGGLVLSATAIIASVALFDEYETNGCDFDDDSCYRRRERAEAAVAGLFVCGLGLGIPTFIIGNRRRSSSTETIRVYRAQNADSGSHDEPTETESPVDGEVSFRPLIGPNGAGLRLNLTF